MSQSIPSNRSFGGFWIRAAAAIVDSMLLLGLAVLVVQLLYGQSYFDWALRPSEGMNRSQFFFNWVLPAIYYIGFWKIKSATLGKMLVKVKIVDAKTGEPASTLQCVVRYLGYFISGLPLALGFLWVAFDKKKQGWHDKIARTLVVKTAGPLPN